MAAAGAVLAVAVNVATGGTARWFPALETRPLWWTAGATVAVAGAGLLAWWAQRWYERGLAVLVPAVQRPDPCVVDRPTEVDQIVRALRRRGRATVGITTAVHGAGGFGKTTVAKLVRADRRVLRRFGGRVYWVTLGRDVRKGALVEKVNDLITQVDPNRHVTFTDVRQAGEHLAAVMAPRPRRLLVLDDVWSEDQVAAFPVAGGCARLVTTRIPSLVACNSVRVKVDQMSVAQARAVLLADLTQPPLPAVVDGLVSETGRWPLLLRLVNKVLASQAQLQLDITAAASDLAERVRRGGALQVDQLTGATGQQLNVSDPDQRQRAVRATIEASTGLLTTADRARFAELAVFAEDEIIPVALIAELWQATGGLDRMTTGTLCARLADLALVTLICTGDGGAIEMHDVIREFLRRELGNAQLAQLHRTLLQAVSANLPTASAATTSGAPGNKITAWWELAGSARYMWDRLIEHLHAAGQTNDAEAVAVDLRWVEARLEQSGPIGPFADLTLIDTPKAERLRRLFAQSAHLLAPTEPPHSLIDILYSRVEHDPDWGPQVTALRRERPLPALINRWTLPDLPDPALRRTLTGHIHRPFAVAIAPDGSWLASAGYDGSVRIWDPVTGLLRATLTGRLRATLTRLLRATLIALGDEVTALAIAPDGTWLASAGYDGSVRIWDRSTGQLRATLTGHRRGVTAVAIAPDGTWLASAGYEGSVRIWDLVTGQQRAAFPAHDVVISVAIAPDGTWLATTGFDNSVRIWDRSTGQLRATLTGHTRLARAVVIAPDGTWLASASYDGSVRIWDRLTGQPGATLTGGPHGVTAVAIAPDGTWLATTSIDGSVRIWDRLTGQPRATLTGHTGWATAVAIAPDGAWLASASYDDGSVRIWDSVTIQRRATRIRHSTSVRTVTFAPDGTWLATVGYDGSVRIWDSVTGQQRAALRAHDIAFAVVIAPDGTWLATMSVEGLVRIWDPVTGEPRATLTGHTGPLTALSVTPDGAWLASASYDGSVRIWDAVTGQLRTTLSRQTRRVTAVAIPADGAWLANAGQVRVTPKARPSRTRLSRVTAVAVAPDGTWLASPGGGWDESVRIWDLVTGQLRTTLKVGTPLLQAHLNEVTAVAIAPDGTWLATTSIDGSVQIWDPVTAQLRATLGVGATFWEAHLGVVTAVAIAPDGTWLATTSIDGSVRIWNPLTGQSRATLTGHAGLVTSVAIAPDGTWLATTSVDRSVRIWNPVTGTMSAIMRLEQEAHSCAWSPCGGSLVVGGDAGLYHFTFVPSRS